MFHTRASVSEFFISGVLLLHASIVSTVDPHIHNDTSFQPLLLKVVCHVNFAYANFRVA